MDRAEPVAAEDLPRAEDMPRRAGDMPRRNISAIGQLRSQLGGRADDADVIEISDTGAADRL